MKNKPRVVFDTNIYISAILFGGNCRICLEQARTGRIHLLTSKAILLELSRKLHEKFDWTTEDVKNVIGGIGVISEMIKPETRIRKIIRDDTDNRILECAVEGEADYIISGDRKHILSLKSYESVRIINPKDFLAIILPDRI